MAAAVPAPLPLAVLQDALLEPGDTAALVARRPVLLNSGHRTVVSMRLMTNNILRWDELTDGRFRVASLADFLERFGPAAVCSDPALDETRVDERTLDVASICGRLQHLIDSGQLEVKAYELTRQFDDALDTATLACRNDAAMQVARGDTFANEAYRVAVAPVGVPGTPGYVAGVMADDLGNNSFQQHLTYSGLKDSFARLRGLRIHAHLFGAQVTREMRVNPTGQFRQVGMRCAATMSKVISSLMVGNVIDRDDALAMPTIMEWIMTHPWPSHLDSASVFDMTPARIIDLNERVDYFQNPQMATTIAAKRFSTSLRSFPILSSKRWMGGVTVAQDAFALYCQLAREVAPKSDEWLRSTMQKVEAYLGSCRGMWESDKLKDLSNSDLVAAIVQHHAANARLLEVADKGAGSVTDSVGSSSGATGFTLGASYSKAELPAIVNTIGSLTFQRAAERVSAAARGADTDMVPLFVWREAMAVQYDTQGNVDESASHIVIMQNMKRPRLPSALHEVFGIMQKYHDYWARYITQYIMWGSDLGVSSNKHTAKQFVIDRKIAAQMLDRSTAHEIDFLNDVFAPIAAARDGGAPEKYTKHLPYASVSALDDAMTGFERLFEALGVAPMLTDSTNAIIVDIKKTIRGTKFIHTALREGTEENLHSLFYGVLEKAFFFIYSAMDSKDPLEAIIRTLVPVGSNLYKLSTTELTECHNHVESIERAMPGVLGALAHVRGSLLTFCTSAFVL